MSTLPPDPSTPVPTPSGTDHDALAARHPLRRVRDRPACSASAASASSTWPSTIPSSARSRSRNTCRHRWPARGQGPQITVRSSAFAETYAHRPAILRQRGAPARPLRPSVAGQGLPLLGGQRHRLHGDAVPAGRHPAATRAGAWRTRPTRPGCAACVDPHPRSALELLHREGVYHRDIAPDNILLPHDGPPVLLDFGAARRVISDRTQSLTAILKPSYAPIEQYAEMAQMRQGPWTDLYALGAVIHYLLFGAPPPPATARAVQDDAESIESRIVPGVSPGFLETVSWMLSLRPNQRPQTGEQLRAVLDGRAEIPSRGRPGITLPDSMMALLPLDAGGHRRRVGWGAVRRADAGHRPHADFPADGAGQPVGPTAPVPTGGATGAVDIFHTAHAHAHCTGRLGRAATDDGHRPGRRGGTAAVVAIAVVAVGVVFAAAGRARWPARTVASAAPPPAAPPPGVTRPWRARRLRRPMPGPRDGRARRRPVTPVVVETRRAFVVARRSGALQACVAGFSGRPPSWSPRGVASEFGARGDAAPPSRRSQERSTIRRRRGCRDPRWPRRGCHAPPYPDWRPRVRGFPDAAPAPARSTAGAGAAATSAIAGELAVGRRRRAPAPAGLSMGEQGRLVGADGSEPSRRRATAGGATRPARPRRNGAGRPRAKPAASAFSSRWRSASTNLRVAALSADAECVPILERRARKLPLAARADTTVDAARRSIATAGPPTPG